jgi:glycine/D-amino acid oxidase-like deaminating enzyme
MKYDRIIIGAGMYGIYAANQWVKRGYSVAVVDCDKAPFQRGSYINQARLHNGYHYPRSYSTASKSAGYFKRFLSDFGDCINTDFTQIYAIASEYSWANAAQFEKFCSSLKIRCNKIAGSQYFNASTVEAAYVTEEYSFDAKLIGEKLYTEAKNGGVSFYFERKIKKIIRKKDMFEIQLGGNIEIETPFVLNATYAGTNQIHNMLGYELLPIKYELCEVILCNVSDNIKNVGLTVMDGPFFSLMPFGKSGYHSITTVSRTPHITCYDALPKFDCQKNNSVCDDNGVANCNNCKYRPESSFIEMRQIARKYMNADIEVEPVESLFTIKPILKTSEMDDSRPTIIRMYSEKPYFYTVFSGKINTMYDLDEII